MDGQQELLLFKGSCCERQKMKAKFACTSTAAKKHLCTSADPTRTEPYVRTVTSPPFDLEGVDAVVFSSVKSGNQIQALQ